MFLCERVSCSYDAMAAKSPLFEMNSIQFGGKERFNLSSLVYGLIKKKILIRKFYALKYGKTDNNKRATCFATLLQNELKSSVARYTTHVKPVLQQIRLLTGLNMGGKTRNISFQLGLQQCCKTRCTFFVTRFPVPLVVLQRQRDPTKKRAPSRTYSPCRVLLCLLKTIDLIF